MNLRRDMIAVRFLKPYKGYSTQDPSAGFPPAEALRLIDQGIAMEVRHDLRRAIDRILLEWEEFRTVYEEGPERELARKIIADALEEYFQAIVKFPFREEVQVHRRVYHDLEVAARTEAEAEAGNRDAAYSDYENVIAELLGWQRKIKHMEAIWRNSAS